MMNTRARAAIAIDKEDDSATIALVQAGRQKNIVFDESHNISELTSESAEIHLLDKWPQDMRSTRPLSKMDRMLKAIVEECGRAAQLRYAISNLKMHDQEQ
jgi:hypothetical protein